MRTRKWLAHGLQVRRKMPESASPKPPAPNLTDLVEDALHQAKTLVQAEFSLARNELKSELKQALGCGGSVDGDIISPRVAIAEGAHFRGSVDMQRKGSQPAQKPQAVPSQKDAAMPQAVAG